MDLVSERVSLKRAGRNLKGLCPFHKEKTPSFNVLPERQIFKCFGCNAGGDLFKFVQLSEGVDFSEALRLLADRAGIQLGSPRADARGAPALGRTEIARANDWAAQWFRTQLVGDVGTEARAYLQRRRVDQNAIARFEIGFAPDDGRLLREARCAGLSDELLLAADLVRASDRGGDIYDTFRNRVVFPIRDASKRCIGFGGRTLGDSPAKYLNTARNELFDKGRCLFGLPLARDEIRERGWVLVVEGYTDCIACHQHGFANTVATLGTAATEDHMRTLRRYVEDAVLLFDSDVAGEAAAERALAVALQQNLRVRIAQVPSGKDPAEYLLNSEPPEFGDLLNSATDALGFLWERTLARFQDARGGSDRRRAVVEFVNLVGELGRFGAVDAIQRGVIIHQVAELLALPANEVTGLFAGRPGRPGRRPRSSADRPTGGSGAGAADAEQLALVGMLEILVCEPGLLGELSTRAFAPERFSNPTYRHIAEVLLRTADRVGEFQAAELLAEIESSDEAALVTDMIVRGMERGNLAVTFNELEDRLQRLEIVGRGRVASDKVKHLKSGGGADPADPADPADEEQQEEDAYLAAVQQGCSLHHFAGESFRRETPNATT